MTEQNAQSADLKRSQQRTVIGVLAVVFTMGSLAFAAVPLYQLFCQVTGFGGTPLRADETTEIAAPAGVDHEVTVYFDANVSGDMPWVFEPVQQSVTVQVGEPRLVYYRAHNPTDKPVAGSATFNVAPLQSGGYFVKIDCFCFQEQVLQPGETIEMPVQFFVDADIVEDDALHDLQTITLSYTFFRRDDLASAE